MHTYLIIKVYRAFSKMHDVFAGGLVSMEGCSIMTGPIIIHRMLSSTLEVTDMAEFLATAGTISTDYSSYSISCSMPLPTGLSIRLAIAEVT